VFKRAAAHRMVGERVDGDDLADVAAAAGALLARAREERAPAVLELTTYRYRGHSVADAGLSYRTKEEIAERQEHDPIERLRARLVDRGTPESELDEARDRAETAVADAVRFAEADPEPPLDELATGMHAPGSDVQFAPMRRGSPFGEDELVFDAGLGR
jgi:pyruvate dehydrogenase E1 component alpha subunit